MVARLHIPSGSRFGRLSVVREAERHTAPCGQTQRRFVVRCSCGGAEFIVLLASLRDGNTASCGCLFRDVMSGHDRALRHGMTGTRTHKSWMAMRERVLDTRKEKARNYLDRGISVCERWQTFENFLADMGVRPVGMTLDRIDGNGNYEPGNCRWATARTQGGNTRKNRMVVLRGETICLQEAARRLQIDPQTAPDMAKRAGVSLQVAVDRLALNNRGRSKRILA